MKTTIIKSNGVRDGTEERVTHNWAAEYAKRLVEKEEYERKKADNALNVKIDNHAGERATGTRYSHVRLSDSVSSTLGTGSATAATPHAVKQAYDKGVEGVSAAAGVRTDLNMEISERKEADNNLQNTVSSLDSRLTAEVRERTGNEHQMWENIRILQSISHSHNNKTVIDTITDERVTLWDRIAELDSCFEYAEFKKFAEELLYGFTHEFQRIYEAIGITAYDGGLFGMNQTDIVLDGGDFTDEVMGAVDCGGFEPYRLTAEVGAVVDGGNY